MVDVPISIHITPAHLALPHMNPHIHHNTPQKNTYHQRK